MFSTAKWLFVKTARESKDVATIFTDFSDNADAKQTVNEKLPSLPIKTLFEKNFGSNSHSQTLNQWQLWSPPFCLRGMC